MEKILVLGAGQIGRLIGLLLAQSKAYQVFLTDLKVDPKSTAFNFLNQLEPACLSLASLDARSLKDLTQFIQKNKITTTICCLPYFCNLDVAQVCRKTHTHYFNLSEDLKSTAAIFELAQDANSIFMPQCGLAPGFISIVGNQLVHQFDQIHSLIVRVGALPQYSHHALKYALTWSTDGLIQEYNQPSYALVQGKKSLCHPLTDLENLVLDGIPYEAFHTSGGIGSLVSHFEGKIETLNYKTLRYPGHCEKMRFLMRELRLGKHPEKLKQLLESSVPKTKQDHVIIYLCAEGLKQNQLYRETYFKKIFPQRILDQTWTAIQIATASSACATVDLVLKGKQQSGFITQESLTLDHFLNNPFACFYKDP